MAKLALEIDPRQIVPVPAEELDRLVRFARVGMIIELGTFDAIGDEELSDWPGDAEERTLALEELERYGELVKELLP